MKLRSTLLAATVLALPMAAHAQLPFSLNGFYIGAGAGVNFLQEENVDSLPGNNPAGGHLRSELGPVAVGTIGYAFGNGLSVELEGDYRQNKFNSLRDAGYPAAAGGNEQKYGPMVNVRLDLTPYLAGVVPFSLAPYIGVGVGYQWDRLQSFKTYGPVGTPTVVSGSTEGAFAYQAILGTILPISTVPGLALTLEYRFMGQLSRSFDATFTSPTGEVSTGKLKLGNEFNHAILVGFRYTFGVAPPPAPAPVAAPAPAPARSYLVFFDWDKATLTDRARQIIREAADNSTHVQYTQLEVNGYTDTSGTPQYNMGLSIRRANAVAAELVRDGVPRNVISIHGFGETHLLVPTGPGVREPQNRRVEIIIR
ncbi:MAG TPA: OmpA family protein [Acetobacteraceae bacterium]|nr:OmpA family protein [Acetobacteraceae bacterium]